MRVSIESLSSWFNYIRDMTENGNYVDLRRYTECFWESQLLSKSLLCKIIPEDSETICVFGGWNGLVAQLIDDNCLVDMIYSIDIDPNCEEVINQYFPNESLKAVTCDMAEFEYIRIPDLVINTSTEHVSQKTYDQWWNKIPVGTKYIVQGNNLAIPEHIRITHGIIDFIEKNHCTKIIDKHVTCSPGPNGDFERYTVLGIKT